MMLIAFLTLDGVLGVDARAGARLISQLYTLTIVTSLPILSAALIALVARRAPAGTRALIWRSVTIAIPAVCIGNLLQLHSLTAVVPGALATPLVALGQVELAEIGGFAPVAASGRTHALLTMTTLVWTLVVVWLAGALAVVCWLAAGWRSLRLMRDGARFVSDPRWTQSLDEARAALGVRQPVTLLVARNITVPITCGILRPTIIVPTSAIAWSAENRRAVLLHEMGHVRGRDLAFALLARAACVALWFHPGIWWIAHRLRSECEHAADDRVLVSGVRASDYAELLLATAANVLGRGVRGPALALSQRGGLRGRLTAIVDTTRDRRAPLGRTMAFAVAVTVAVAAPAASVRLAPTREVLTTLMRDARWESRAYAVIGLAQRADSVDVARAAAEGDPSPRVRAWAKFALSRSTVPLVAPLAEPRARATPSLPSSAGSPS